MAKKEHFRDVVEKIWPKTQVELEKAIKNAKKLLNSGEKYLKDVSEIGKKNTQKISMNIKREKLCYDLGKLISSTSQSKWATDKKIDRLIKEIKRLSRKVKSID
ncbi:MAG: hypothetical protein PHU64_05670 [Candidatus Omnitrophica bacterium]|nr:hypothetical protein [Candidatus Omnitrophota bacterium]MDD5429686.1 hypothetical protein [Candidatus Omnitrophota bacterium]